MSFSVTQDRYDSMIYRRCGASGVKLPLLSLGLWHNFGDQSDPENCRAMIFTAFNAGITHFDLANNYGPNPGAAETTFGRILANDFGSHRDEIFISTKAGYTMWKGSYGDWGSRKYLLASLDQSLKRLGLDYVDLFYSHRYDSETPLEETMDALAQAVRSGKALYVGISNYPADAAAKAAEILRTMGTRCLIHQQRYNLFQNACENALFPVLKRENMGMIAFCPLAQGLLTDKYLHGITMDSRAGGSSIFLNAETVHAALPRIRKLHNIAVERGQTLAQMALAWVLRDESPVTSALIGASRPAQITENVAALRNLSFSSEELASLLL